MKDPESHLLVQRPEVQQRIVEIKSEDPTVTWELVGDKIEEEFGKRVGVNLLNQTYKRALATSITVDKRASKQFTHLLDLFKERFEKQVERTEILAQAFDGLIVRIDNSDMDDFQKASTKLNLIGSFEKLNKVFQQQMGAAMEEIDKIKIEQKKIIYTDADIIQKINDSVPYILQQFEDDGKIAIIDKSVLNK